MTFKGKRYISRFDAELKGFNILLASKKYTDMVRKELVSMNDKELENLIDNKFDSFEIVK